MKMFAVNWNNGGRTDSFTVTLPDDLGGKSVTSAVWAEIRKRIDPDKVTSVWDLNK